MIDTTINMGHVIQFIAMVGGGAWFLWEMRTRLALLQSGQDTSNKRLDGIDSEIKQLGKYAIEIAKQETRMDAIDHRIQELSNRNAEQSSKFADAIQMLISAQRTTRKIR